MYYRDKISQHFSLYYSVFEHVIERLGVGGEELRVIQCNSRDQKKVFPLTYLLEKACNGLWQCNK